MPEFTYSEDLVRQAMVHPIVLAALEDKARAIQGRAEAEYSALGIANADVELTTGVRPKGRPYARVSTNKVDEEWGTYTVPKRRILATAAGMRGARPQRRKKTTARLTDAQWKQVGKFWKANGGKGKLTPEQWAAVRAIKR